MNLLKIYLFLEESFSCYSLHEEQSAYYETAHCHKLFVSPPLVTSIVPPLFRRLFLRCSADLDSENCKELFLEQKNCSRDQPDKTAHMISIF